MNISNAFPSKYLKAADLNGKSHDLTIREVKMEDVGGNNVEEESKPVLYFEGKQKGIVLNRTNTSAITFKYGEETDDWEGKALEVYPDRTPFNGNMVACIRVKVPLEKAQKTDNNDDDFNDDVPF